MGRKQRSDGDGSVYQLHTAACPKVVDGVRPSHKCNGKWRAVLVTRYINGKPVRKTATGTTKNAASVKLRELHEKHDATTLPIGKAPTVEQWLNHCTGVLLPRKVTAGKFKETSLVNYKGVTKNYLIPLLGHQRLDRLTADDIDNAWQTMAEIGNPLLGASARPLAPATIHHAHVVLVRCLRLAVQRKRIQVNPAGPDSMDAPSKGSNEVEPLATEDWKKVLSAAPQVANTARWTVGLAIGLRQGETLALRWDEDVDLAAGTLRVQRTMFRLPTRGLLFGPPKTERSKRTVVLPKQLVAELKGHRKTQNEQRLHAGDQWQDNNLVFCMEDGRPIDPSVDRRRWGKLLELAGVHPIKLHAARHTAATILLLAGVDPRIVMDIMGWSQISTAAHYQHAVKEAQRAAADVLGTAVWGQTSS